MPDIARRELLKRAARAVAWPGLAALALDACAPSAQKAAPPRTTQRDRKSAGPAAPATPADWTRLGRSLTGQLVLPSDPAYRASSQVYDTIYDGARPAAIAYCASTGDVASCVGYAGRHGLRLSPRSGGHSYGGYSTGPGLVLDVSRLSAVQLDPATGLATVGAGTRLVDMYAALARGGVAIPSGSCPTIGIAGITMGGGMGVLSRKLGLTCDSLVEAEVVTAAGTVTTCNQSQHPDLFWALRGGGGGNFGIVTSLRFTTHPVGQVSLFSLTYPWSQAATVLDAWQRFAPSAPDELWSNCLLLAGQPTPSGPGLIARVAGAYLGPVTALQGLVANFLAMTAAGGAAPFDSYFGAHPYMQAMLVEAGCAAYTQAECHLRSPGPASGLRPGLLPRASFAAKSDYIAANRPLPRAGIAALIDAVSKRQGPGLLQGGGAEIDAQGGAINRVPPAATAFVHRDSLASIQYSAYWSRNATAPVIAANRAWLESTWLAMRPYVNGQAYQNYIDPALPGWQDAYYGSNLGRLEQVKARYDPTDVFRFAQSVPLPGG
ncbi:MAG: FAD-binding oxidoreductase [Acidimicrobiales bacterium]